MFFPAIRYGKWIFSATLLTLVAGLWLLYRAGSDRARFVDRLYVGYEDAPSLIPALAALDPAQHDAMLPDIIRKSWSEVFPTLSRIFKGAAREEDWNYVSGSNWIQVALLDDANAAAMGAEAWQMAVMRELREPDNSIEARVERLRYWPPALFHLNRARIYNRKFLTAVVERLGRDASAIENTLPSSTPDFNALARAMALHEAGVHFHKLPLSRQWRRKAEQVMEGYLKACQKPDGTLGTMEDTLQAIETIMPPMAMAYRARVSLPDELSSRIQKLLEFLTICLDMNGCAPFVPAEEEFANKREWLFWGSRIFQRPDFAWVAYGGLDALEMRPPRNASQAFPDMGLYIMRNNWEIRRFAHRGRKTERADLSSGMSHTLWVDSRKGSLELFAFGERQVRLSLPSAIQVQDWRIGKRGVVFQGIMDSGKLTVVHLVDEDVWIVRMDGPAAEAGVTIIPLRVTLKEMDQEGWATCPPQATMNLDGNTGVQRKGSLSLGIRTDGIVSTKDKQELCVKKAAANGSLMLVMLEANVNRKVELFPDECMFEIRKKRDWDEIWYGDNLPEETIRIFQVLFDGGIAFNNEPL